MPRQPNMVGRRPTRRTDSHTKKLLSIEPTAARTLPVSPKRPAQNAKRRTLTAACRLLDSGAHGVVQDSGRGTDSFSRSADGGVEESERYPGPASQAEEGSQGRPRPDRANPQ